MHVSEGGGNSCDVQQLTKIALNIIIFFPTILLRQFLIELKL